MEDILASIRRILSEDETGAGGAAAPPAEHPPTAEGKPEKNVLVLDPSMMVGEPRPGASAKPPAGPEPPPATEPPPRAAAPSPTLAPAEPPQARAEPALGARADANLVAPEAAAAAATSLGTLMRTLSGRATQVYGGGPTLEDMVREEIRPLLKQWLDEHLPPIVERVVRIEIERVVGRAVP